MKTLVVEQVEQTPEIDNSVEIKTVILKNWDEFYTKEELVDFVENYFIFGPKGSEPLNQHYHKSYLLDLVNQVEVELTPIPIEEGVPDEIIPEEKEVVE